MRISVIGLGRLGAPLAAILADSGAKVVGADCDRALVARLANGILPEIEPELAALWHRAAGRIAVTASVADAVSATEATFILVPTPSTAEGGYSPAHLRDAIAEAGAAIASKPGRHLVTIVSTVMPGTMEEVIAPALVRAAGRPLGDTLGLCYCPEFVALGAIVEGMRQPDLVLIGQSDAAAGNELEALLRPIWTREPAVRKMQFINAEIAKIAINGFVTAKISYANMLAEICERLPGADAAIVTATMGIDARIAPGYLQPGLGFGGPCFPRDNAALAALAARVGTSPDLAEAAAAINLRQPGHIVALVQRIVPSGTVGVLGLAYKGGSDVCEASQGIAIAAELAAAGYRVQVHDPVARPVLPPGVAQIEDAETCVRTSAIVVIATPWPDYGDLGRDWLERPSGKLTIIDCWRMPGLRAHDGIVDLIYPGTAQS